MCKHLAALWQKAGREQSLILLTPSLDKKQVGSQELWTKFTDTEAFTQHDV